MPFLVLSQCFTVFYFFIVTVMVMIIMLFGVVFRYEFSFVKVLDFGFEFVLVVFHNAHVVSNSIYPFIIGLCVTSLFLSFVVFIKSGLFVIILYNIFFFIFVLLVWIKDVILEGFSGYHNMVVDHGFKIGFLIFILTEVIFFFSIFWVFLDKMCIGNYFWWPVESELLDYFGLPFFGTLLLLSSGLFSTWSHNCLIKNCSVVSSLLITIFLGLLFLFVQLYEYKHLFFDISDGWSGSIFFFITGFHGFHVLLGLILLTLSLIRFGGHYMTGSKYFFEGSVVYWHFVDVVWLLLYLMLYL